MWAEPCSKGQTQDTDAHVPAGARTGVGTRFTREQTNRKRRAARGERRAASLSTPFCFPSRISHFLSIITLSLHWQTRLNKQIQETALRCRGRGRHEREARKGSSRKLHENQSPVLSASGQSRSSCPLTWQCFAPAPSPFISQWQTRPVAYIQVRE